MNTEGIPKRRKSLFAKSYFYHNYNDIDFFIEDTGKNTIKIILKLLQRSLSEEIKLTQLFPLGGKENVIEKYSSRDPNRTQLFLIDVDLNILYEESIFQKGLVVLDKYSIENYLIDDNAIHSLLYEESVRMADEDQVRIQFDYYNWMMTQELLLKELFIEYGIEKEHNLRIQTVKYPVSRLQTVNMCNLDSSLVFTRITDLSAQIKSYITHEQYDLSKEKILSTIDSGSRNPLDYVSVKDYFLPLLFLRIKKFSNSNSNSENFKYRLACNCNIESLHELLSSHI